MWFDLISSCFFASCDLPILVNQTPRLEEILCFLILCFARAFLSYSCLFPTPALLESSNSNKPLHNYFCYRYVSKKTLCGLSCSCGVVFHPSSAAPTIEGFTTAGIRSPDCISPPQIFFPAAGSHDNCITIINWEDDLEDYTVPQERSHSSVFAYVMHRLIWWHATLSSCSPIRLRVRSKLMLKLEFLNGCGVHIGATISTICLLSG